MNWACSQTARQSSTAELSGYQKCCPFTDNLTVRSDQSTDCATTQDETVHGDWRHLRGVGHVVLLLRFCALGWGVEFCGRGACGSTLEQAQFSWRKIVANHETAAKATFIEIGPP
jgi:hypothetical protein